jgi:hypothetical protein
MRKLVVDVDVDLLKEYDSVLLLLLLLPLKVVLERQVIVLVVLMLDVFLSLVQKVDEEHGSTVCLLQLSSLVIGVTSVGLVSIFHLKLSAREPL